MFNFYCDLCGDYQKNVARKYSVESFEYFTPIEGNINFDFKFVCKDCIESIEKVTKQLRKEQDDV
tara:strand:- start:59 stop:253 length:195 start_codon:yes stop_codon:yes gene_type:complete